MDRFQRLIYKNSFLRSILQPFMQIPKVSQEEYDIYTAALVLNCRTLRSKLDRPLTDDDANSVLESIESSTFASLKSGINSSLNQQIVKIFQSISKADEIWENEKSLGSKKDHAIEIKKHLSINMSFTLALGSSAANGAGEGVFLQGKASPGDIVALYPGLVHLSEYTKYSAYIECLLPDDDLLLMSRMDGIIIDGRTSHRMPWNPYALGHKINHPPTGVTPNVLQVAYDFPGDPLNIYCFPKELRKYIPNKYAKDPTFLGTPDRSACMHGLVLIAMEPIADNQELFMNYRLNPNLKTLPRWYSHVDVDEANRRWSSKDGNETKP